MWFSSTQFRRICLPKIIAKLWYFLRIKISNMTYQCMPFYYCKTFCGRWPRIEIILYTCVKSVFIDGKKLSLSLCNLLLFLTFHNVASFIPYCFLSTFHMGNSRPKLCPRFGCCPQCFAHLEIYFIKSSVNIL